MRQVKKRDDRKKHVFKKQSKNGKNVTKPTKYTANYVLREVRSMLNELKADEGVAGVYKILDIGELMVQKPYTQSRYHEWTHKFGEDQKISVSFSKIKEILLTRLKSGMMRGILNVNGTKFVLANDYGMREIEKVEVTSSNTMLFREIIQKSREDDERERKVKESCRFIET